MIPIKKPEANGPGWVMGTDQKKRLIGNCSTVRRRLPDRPKGLDSLRGVRDLGLSRRCLSYGICLQEAQAELPSGP